MLIDSALISRGSGSLGGLTMSHNAGGLYLRARVTPTDPNTPQQATIRAFVAQLTSLWVNTLTQVERDKWSAYAANVTLIGPLGAAINVSGLNMYVRSNVPILQAGFPRRDDAPAIFDLGDFTAPTITAIFATQDVFLAFTITDAWVNETGAAMMLFLSRPQNESINFFKGPYRFAGSVAGDLAIPPTSPATIPSQFTIAVGQKLFGRAQVFRIDGRLSADVRFETIVL